MSTISLLEMTNASFRQIIIASAQLRRQEICIANYSIHNDPKATVESGAKQDL